MATLSSGSVCRRPYAFVITKTGIENKGSGFIRLETRTIVNYVSIFCMVAFFVKSLGRHRFRVCLV